MQKRLTFIGRRDFCKSVVGSALGAAAVGLPLQTEQESGLPPQSPDFAIVNGWVLTREDLASSEIPPNAV